MAKMNLFNKMAYRLKVKKVERLERQIDFQTSYIPIYAEKVSEKTNKIIQRKYNDHVKELYQLELNTLNETDYINELVGAKINKNNTKFDLKKRALKQSLKRKAKNGSIDQTYLDEQLLLVDNEAKQQNDILVQQAKEAYALIDVKEAKTIFDSRKKELTVQLEDEKNQRVANDQVKIENHTKISEAKIAKLSEQLTSAKASLSLLLESSEYNQYFGENDHLVVNNLTMQFGGLKAVNDLSFKVKKGEIFGLIGPNGAGKTTVFNCITQFYKATEGDMYYLNNKNEIVYLNQYKVHDVIKTGIVRTFQNVELVYELSVLDNLLVGSHSKFRSGFFQHAVHSPGFRREEEILKSKAIQILKDLEIDNYMYFYPIGLPYGVLKKIELARTLMTNPNLIILDEPAAGLNDMETKELAKTIKKIQKDYNCTIFLVEHDMGLVMDICDTICAISFGKKLAIGTPLEIKSNKLVQEAYLGGE